MSILNGKNFSIYYERRVIPFELIELKKIKKFIELKKLWVEKGCYIEPGITILGYEKIMSPKFLLLAHVYIAEQKYRKTIISHNMITYSPENSYFKVTIKLLMAQLHNTDFLKASRVKVQDIMVMSAYIP